MEENDNGKAWFKIQLFVDGCKGDDWAHGVYHILAKVGFESL